MNDCMSVLLVIFEYISQLQIVQFAKSHGLTMGAIGTFASITYGLYTDRPNLKIEFIPDSPVSCVTKENYDSKTILSASAYMRVSNIGKRTTTVKAVKLVVLTKKTTFIRCIVNLILRCCCMIELSKFRYLKILNPKIVLGDWQYEIGEGVKKYPKLIQRSEETFMNNDLVIVSGGSITGGIVL